MKIEITYSEDTEDFREAIRITLETETTSKSVEFMEGEPEDAYLSRDYSDCYEIEEMLKKAYEAGHRGEELSIVRKNVDWCDF